MSKIAILQLILLMLMSSHTVYICK